MRFTGRSGRSLGAVGIALFLLPTSALGGGRPCPPDGADLSVALASEPSAEAATVLVFGTLEEPSCDAGGTDLATSYAAELLCAGDGTDACSTAFSRLQPGRWAHRVAVVDGAAAGQFQGRTGLLLATRAGINLIEWPLYRSVATISNLDDAADCRGCLREAIEIANQAEKPALVQFAFGLAGTIVLAEPAPALSAGSVTLDAFDVNGRPFRRTIDGNGFRAAAVRITSADNRVAGLRVVGVGGDSDSVLIDGPEANRNVLETIEVMGRSTSVCESGQRGCIVDGECRTIETDPPFGACGDDGIAVRGAAGRAGANVIRDCDVSGGFDKGIKISNAAVARVERCDLHDNADGGLQATLGGQVVASENLIENNRGTNSANGLAANGPEMSLPPPAILVTRGNLTRFNALRGISIRSQSFALLDSDYVCGNGTVGGGAGVGVVVQDAAGLSAAVTAEGLAVVYNLDGGLVVSDRSTADLGGAASAGWNAFAFNGRGTEGVNVRNLTGAPLAARNNQWEHCGRGWHCDVGAVLTADVFASDAPVFVARAQARRERHRLRIDSISPSYAEAGDLVRIYGSGFDAIRGNGPGAGCLDIASQNGCRPVRGNCVVVGGVAAEVVAVTPTMLAVVSPFTCVEPVPVVVRNRHARGVGRATFCTLPAASAGARRTR